MFPDQPEMEIIASAIHAIPTARKAVAGVKVFEGLFASGFHFSNSMGDSFSLVSLRSSGPAEIQSAAYILRHFTNQHVDFLRM